MDVVGYTDSARGPDAARRIARERAALVHRYYLAGGVAAERLRFWGAGLALPPCNSGKADPTCRTNRRVESIPLRCADLLPSRQRRP